MTKLSWKKIRNLFSVTDIVTWRFEEIWFGGFIQLFYGVLIPPDHVFGEFRVSCSIFTGRNTYLENVGKNLLKHDKTSGEDEAIYILA